jgi:hypothetical protein
MKLALALTLACLGTVGACKKTNPQPSAETAGSSGATERAQPPGGQPPGGANGSASAVATEVEATMAEFLAYSESVIVILREHGKDCDQAAKHLASRAPVFLELGPRMMRMKEALQALPEQERARIKQASEPAMEAFKARNSDVEAIEQMGKACEKSSPAFAEIAPKVMFVKKK